MLLKRIMGISATRSLKVKNNHGICDQCMNHGFVTNHLFGFTFERSYATGSSRFNIFSHIILRVVICFRRFPFIWNYENTAI